MSKNSKDLKKFITAIDAIAERLAPPKRSEDTGAPDCTIPQLAALKALSQHGHLNMSELTARIDVPMSTATRIVDQLVAKNLFVRKPSQQDARRIEVSFSSHGSEINTYIAKARQKQALSMLESLPKNERALFLDQLSMLLGSSPKK